MRCCTRRDAKEDARVAEGDRLRLRRRPWFADSLILASLIAVIILAATWVAQPRLRIQAAASDSSRVLVRFWPAEENGRDIFRWSRVDSAVRLFGFEQQAPVVVGLRLTAIRGPAQPPALLTVVGAQPLPPVVIQPLTWRRYRFILPPLQRGDEAPLLTLHSSATVIEHDSRDLGVVLGDVEAFQYPLGPAQRLPAASRLAFLVLLGLLIHAVLRRLGIAPTLALVATASLACVLGLGIVLAPGLVAYWLPNMWFACAAGWAALAIAPIVHMLRRHSTRLPVIALSGLCAIAAAQALLPLHQVWSSAAGWALLLGGMLLVSALPVRDSSTGLGAGALLGLLSLSLIAFVLRLYALDRLPLGMWRDEARHGLLALRILHDAGFRPVYVPEVADIPALLFYLDAAPIALFGPHPWTVRVVPAIAGALTPLTLYWLARPLFGLRVALLSAGFMAASVWHIALSRLGFAATLGPPLTILALGLIWRALQSDASPRRHILAGLAGASCGLAVYAYHPSRLAPLVFALAVAIILGRGWRAWHSAGARLAVAAACMLLVLGPLIAYGLTDPAGYTRRLDQTTVFNEDASAGHAPAGRIEQNARLVLGMWNERGDENSRHNLSGAPMLDPLTGAAFVVGAGALCIRLRERRARIVLVWLGVMLIPALLSNQEPHAVRTVEAIAPSMLLAGIGASALLGWVVELRPWRYKGGRLGWAAGGSLLVCVLALNSWRYFVAWPATTRAYQEFYVAETHTGDAVQRLAGMGNPSASGYRVFLPHPRGDNDVLDYLTYGIAVESYLKQRFAASQGAQVLLITYGASALKPEQVRRLLGSSAMLVGEGPRSPLDGRPEFLVYGRDAAAREFVIRALTSQGDQPMTLLAP